MSSKIPLLLIFFASLCFSGLSVDFDVGNTRGWEIPPANNSNFYNEWASKNRFRVGDAIHFKYEKDSVMMVSEIEYKDCISSHPSFFSNNGNTQFKFDRSGLFYFISGVSGHCERGQKMIIKVMSDDSNKGDSSGAATTILVNVAASTLITMAVVHLGLISF
ncbi:hypothetical protein Scep_021096 [Stephania cephalantha]|uniref:Phytocyanin domain-containing protein n=1 Tax=Stephania cephalantha TaxID=152367 RepID=A0AAP0F8D7_9MAGN